MIKLLTTDLKDEIKELFSTTKSSLLIVSPFLSDKTAELMCEAKRQNADMKCCFITRLYLNDMLDHSNSFKAIEMMLDTGIDVYAVNGLHTKLYLFDKEKVILGSANFTVSGLSKNLELSILTDEEDVINPAIDYFEELAQLCDDADGKVTHELCEEIKKDYNEKLSSYHKGNSSTKIYGVNISLGENVSVKPIDGSLSSIADDIRIKEYDVVNEALSPKKVKAVDNNNGEIYFKTIRDAMDKIWKKSVPMQQCYFDTPDDRKAWFPQDKNKDWKNTLSDDGTHWYETPLTPKSDYSADYKLRYVFAKEQKGYRYTGVFKYVGIEEDMTRVYELVDDENNDIERLMK